MKKKYLSILGSTGSIGKSAVEVVRHLGKEKVEVVALSAKSNAELLQQQAKELQPKMVVLVDEKGGKDLKKNLKGIKVVTGREGLLEAATHEQADIVLNAIVGTEGLLPTIHAIQAKKTLALANKEALISGGSLIMNLAKKYGVSIIPVDSEHSAIFQCLKGEDRASIRRLVITASGGPFRKKSLKELEMVTLEEALLHPTWSMGSKITIDSSTLMNKGLEVIEAHHLFGIPLDQIDVVTHPQSIIHSMVEFNDGSILAQMHRPSMIVPIQYAITFPCRERGLLEPFDFTRYGTLEFDTPDGIKFPCLPLAFHAAKTGGSAPCYLNAANQILVERFLSKEIRWLDISKKLSTLLDNHSIQQIGSIDDVLSIDREARLEASKI